MTQSVIEAAKSGRAKCGGCKKKIDQGDLRFGAYNERWDSHRWYHLVCGAGVDPVDFVEAAEEFGDVGDLDAILAEAKNIGKGTKTPRVEPAPSDRSSCVVCESKIEPKGVMRGVIFREIEVDQWRKGYVHVGCMSAVSDLDRDDLIDAVITNSILTDEQAEGIIEAI